MSLRFLSLCLMGVSSCALSLEINQLDRCEAGVAKHTNAQSVVVYDQVHNALTGWNHIDVELDEFAQLKERSDLDVGNHEPRYCVECWPSRSALVVKLSDWTRQHATGVEIRAFETDLPFGELAGIELELKLSAKGSVIPSQVELANRYRGRLSKAQLDAVDRSNANLGISLFTQPQPDSNTTLNAEAIITLDQTVQSERWLNVFIPISEFEVFNESNYQRTDAYISEHQSIRLAGLRLVAETENGQQLRNVMGEQWSPALPETFKSLDISICRISLRRTSSSTGLVF